MANKPTQKEKEHRIAKVLKMLVDGYTKGEIKRECRERFDASARTVERYLQQARNLLIEELEEPIEAIKAHLCQHTYTSVWIARKPMHVIT